MQLSAGLKTLELGEMEKWNAEALGLIPLLVNWRGQDLQVADQISHKAVIMLSEQIKRNERMAIDFAVGSGGVVVDAGGLVDPKSGIAKVEEPLVKVKKDWGCNGVKRDGGKCFGKPIHGSKFCVSCHKKGLADGEKKEAEKTEEGIE